MKWLVFLPIFQLGAFLANEITSVPEVSTVTTPTKQFRRYNNFNYLMQLYAQNARLETHVTHLRSANRKLSNKVNEQGEKLIGITSVLDVETLKQIKDRVDKLEKTVAVLQNSNESKDVLIKNLISKLTDVNSRTDSRLTMMESNVEMINSSSKTSVRFCARLTSGHITSGEAKPIKYNQVSMNVGSGYDPNTKTKLIENSLFF